MASASESGHRSWPERSRSDAGSAPIEASALDLRPQRVSQLASMASASKKQKPVNDLERWNAVLAAYRKAPGAHTQVGLAAGVDRKTARKLWEVGDPRRGYSTKPIKDVIFDERQASVARAVREEAAARAVQESPGAEDVRLAREGAIRAQAEEVQLVRVARLQVQALLGMTTHLSATAIKLSVRVEQTLANPEFADKMTLAQALLTLSRIAGIVQKGIYAAESVAGLERMVLGSPAERAQQGLEAATSMSDEEALEELGRAVELADMLRARGLVVLDGGRGKVADEDEAATNEVAKGEVMPPPLTPTPGPREGAPEGEVTGAEFVDAIHEAIPDAFSELDDVIPPDEEGPT